MKSPCVGNLPPNEVVTAQFLVVSKEIRQKKTGEPYLSLHLADRTGEIEAKMWDNVAEVMTTFDRDDFVKVKALVQIYQNRSQLTVHRLRRLEDHEVDFADYFPCSERDPEEMFSELQSIIAGLGNSHLQSLLNAIFADTRLSQAFKMAPAAKNIHHACRGGLLEHVLSLCALSRLLGSHYQSQNIDLDLLLTGAILHDIGKVEELSYARSFGYSADGQLLGHIIIGLRMIGSKIDTLDGFPPKLRTLLEHLIISHHGELEFGSPKVPAFPEALLLHHVDNLDSKMNAMRTALNRDRSVDGEFTGWIPSLERVLLKKERYLETEAAHSVAPAAAPQSPAETPGPQPAADGVEIPVEVVQAAHPEPPCALKPPLHHTEHRPERRPPTPTLFGEKLQAVLDPRK